MKRVKRSLLGTAAAAVVLGGCYDLAVENTSGVGRETVLNSPADVERFVAGAFVNLWSAMTNGYPWTGFSVMAEQMESSNDGFGAYDLGKVPREAFQNSAEYNRFSFVKSAWAIFYETIANADDALAAIDRNNLKIVDVSTNRDNTSRTVSFAKMLQGTGHLYLAMLYDQAAIIPETVDLQEVRVLPLEPHREVLDSGIKFMGEALSILDTANFVLPNVEQLWIYGTPSSSGELEQFIHSQLARAKAYVARTPTERAAAPWQEILDHIDRGIVLDFGPRGRPNSLLDFGYWQTGHTHPVGLFAGNNTTNSARYRVDMRIVGPADTTGAYATWLAAVEGGDINAHPPTIGTPDQRIEPPPFDSVKSTNRIIRYYPVDPPSSAMPIERGTKYYSPYWFNVNAPLGNHLDELSIRQHIVLTIAEMNLLKAEALIRLTRVPEAVTIINASRTAPVGAGPNLPPIVANASLDLVIAPEDSASCVPKRTSGQCGNLWDALIYEKRLLTYGYDGLTAFADMRGWGCLEPGTLLHLPVPGDQLILMNEPVYTFGGQPGQPGSAGEPNPAMCQMFYHFD